MPVKMAAAPVLVKVIFASRSFRSISSSVMEKMVGNSISSTPRRSALRLYNIYPPDTGGNMPSSAFAGMTASSNAYSRLMVMSTLASDSLRFGYSLASLSFNPCTVRSTGISSSSERVPARSRRVAKNKSFTRFMVLYPGVIRRRLFIDDIARVNRTCRLHQQNVALLRGKRFMFHSLRYDEHLPILEQHIPIAELDFELTLQDNKDFIGFTVIMPD